MDNFFKKIIFINLGLFLLFLLFIPFVSNAADKMTAGEFRKICWTEEECMKDSKGNKTLGEIDKDGCNSRYCWEQGKGGCEDDFGVCYVKPSAINLQVPIPGDPGSEGGKSINTLGDNVGNLKETRDVTGFPAYLKVLYRYFISIIGIVAVMMIAYGGYEWIMAAGSAEKISKAKNTIQGAMIGLLLGIGSYAILNLINDSLVNIKNLKVERIKPMVLATECNDKVFSGVKDWVLESAPSNNTEGKQRCGDNYISKSDNSMACKGMDCSYSGSPGKYCIKENIGWKCVSAEEMEKDCNDIEEVYNYPGLCEEKDKEWAEKYPELPRTCKLKYDWGNTQVNNYISWQITAGSANFLYNWISGQSQDSMSCVAYTLVKKPNLTKRVYCQGHAPSCWSKEGKYGYHGCSNPPIRVGKDYNSMCVKTELCVPESETHKCSSYGMRDGCEKSFEPDYCNWFYKGNELDKVFRLYGLTK